MSHTKQKAIIFTNLHQSFYVGRLENILQRANVSPTLLVSIEDELELYVPDCGETLRTRSLLIPPGIDVKINTHGAKVAQCFLDDLGASFAHLAPNMKNKFSADGNRYIYSEISTENQIIEAAHFLSEARPDNLEAQHIIENCISFKSTHIEFFSDERVTKAVSLIKENYSANMSVTDIAKQVNLSVPRLVQLFKQVTGTPIRRFRLWHRIFVTADKLTEGYSLTEAAIAAGFSDYAQFSRVYKELSGASPAAAKKNTEIRVLKAV